MMRFLVLILALLNAASSLAGDPPKTYTPTVVDQWWQSLHTLADAKSIRTAIEAYAVDNNRYPAAANMEELRKLVQPIYIRTMPTEDAWGTPFLYRVSADGKSYTIASAGSDRKFDESTWKPGYTMSSKEDLVYQGDDEREWVIQDRCK